MPSRGNRTGRIRSDQRPIDNSAPSILGQNLSDIGEDYEDALHETVKLGRGGERVGSKGRGWISERSQRGAGNLGNNRYRSTGEGDRVQEGHRLGRGWSDRAGCGGERQLGGAFG
jgi:hypothetical protein